MIGFPFVDFREMTKSQLKESGLVCFQGNVYKCWELVIKKAASIIIVYFLPVDLEKEQQK